MGIVARMVVRLLQKAGCPQAKCEGFRITNYVAKAELGHPVRLERIMEKWPRHAMYDPDITPNLVFYVAEPQATLQVTSTGKVKIYRTPDAEAAREVLRRVHHIFREFSV